MKAMKSVALALLLAGCAGYSGSGLVPGRSTAAEVEAVMGPATDRRARPNGETVLWVPRMPYGDGTYAARVGADGRLVALEQRLTEENNAQIERGRTTADQVPDLVGPPYRGAHFPPMERGVWTVEMQGFPFPKPVFVQLSPR